MMKNLVDPIKLTEPVKPVNNQSLSVNQQKPQQQGEQASGQNDFQAMLDKQVQERRQQNKTLEANKQQNKAAETPNKANQPKTEAAAKAPTKNNRVDATGKETAAKIDAKEAIQTKQDPVEKTVAENASKGDVKPQADHTKHGSVKTHTSKEALQPSNDHKFVKNAKNGAEEANAPLAKKEDETESRSTTQPKHAGVGRKQASSQSKSADTR